MAPYGTGQTTPCFICGNYVAPKILHPDTGQAIACADTGLCVYAALAERCLLDQFLVPEGYTG